MKITSTEKSKKAEGMLRIYIDDAYAFSIPEKDYVCLHVYETDELDEDQLQLIRATVLMRAAKEKAVQMLIAKDRCEAELHKRLVEKGFDEDIAQLAMDELKTIGYINDRRYIQKFISDKMSIKSMSHKAIRYELVHKGVDEELIDDVLSEFEVDEEEVALRALKKKFGKYDIGQQAIQQKMIVFLMHRGYSVDIAKHAIRRMLGEHN